jgi:hypothetical protein
VVLWFFLGGGGGERTRVLAYMRERARVSIQARTVFLAEHRPEPGPRGGGRVMEGPVLPSRLYRVRPTERLWQGCQAGGFKDTSPPSPGRAPHQ